MKLFFILSSIIYIFYISCKSKKYLHMLQQNWYNDGNKYIKWLIENYKKVFINYELIFLVLLLINYQIGFILFSFIYFVLFFWFYFECKKEQSKKPLAITARIKRLCVTTLILYLIVITILFFNLNRLPICIILSILGLFSLLDPFIIFIANIVNKPIENIIFNHYKKKASNKLNEMTSLKRIGITGSYGKTSTKNFLNDILNVKFNSFATEKSFNTMNGLMISINDKLDKFSDIFIAEMGAFRRGEIKEKADFIKPQYGILTKIGTAHLETFGSINNTQKAKFELIDSLPEDGIAVLNMDDEYQTSYEVKSKCKQVWVSCKNKSADVYAHDIKLSNKGTSFKCKIKGCSKEYKFETRLLGDANVYNIIEAIALAYNLGMSEKEIVQGVKQIRPVEHRLQLRNYSSNITIIDDAFNSNPVGSKMAVDVLGLMPGKKIIVTPGMIELGSEEYNLNKEFGRQIAEVCDEVILIGEVQTKPIYDGLMEKKFNKDNIHVLNDVKKSFPLMQRLSSKDTYVLLENDLPDIFNE